MVFKNIIIQMKTLRSQLANEIRLARESAKRMQQRIKWGNPPITEGHVALELINNLCFKIDGGWKRRELVVTVDQKTPIIELRATWRSRNKEISIADARVQIIANRTESDKFLFGTYENFFESIDRACKRAGFCSEFHQELGGLNLQESSERTKRDLENEPKKYITLYRELRKEGYSRPELIA